MKILMVYPEIPPTYWSLTYMLPFLGKKSVLPPLGLMTVAALLPERHEVRLVDMNVSPLAEKDVLEADLVFLSAMIIQKASFDKVVELCGRLGRTVVAGGPYAMSSHEKIKGVDHFVLGEAEVTLPRFMEDYEQGVPARIYPSDIKPDITATPPPRMDLIDTDRYLAMALQFSRGCPFNCEFCDIIEMFGRRPRTKTAEQFIGEMEKVLDSGFRGSIFIVDDNFIGNKKKVKELLKAVVAWQKKRGYPFQFFTEASIDISGDEDLLELMREASFDFVFIGIETPDTDTLKQIQKGHNTRLDLEEAVGKIVSHRIGVAGGFIVGFDTDREDIFDRQIDFMRQTGIPMAMVGLLVPMPNTQLYRRLEKEGRLVEEWTGNNTHDLSLNYVPAMDPETLREGYRKVISTIYSPEEYFNRCLTTLEMMPTKKIGARPVGLMEIQTFFRSLFRQTFSSYGTAYLRFLWKGLRLSPGYLPDLITMAIHGHHFMKITDEIVGFRNGN